MPTVYKTHHMSKGMSLNTMPHIPFETKYIQGINTILLLSVGMDCPNLKVYRT